MISVKRSMRYRESRSGTTSSASTTTAHTAATGRGMTRTGSTPYAPSPSGRPKRPHGRQSSTTSRMRNGKTSCQFGTITEPKLKTNP